jgi:hypothetical protein
MHQAPPPREVDTQLYPVSISHEPPFTMFTRLGGQGDVAAGGQDADVVLTAYGTWQPGLAATRRPSVVHAVVGALAQHQDRHKLLQPATQQVKGPAGGEVTQDPVAQVEQQAAGQASPELSPEAQEQQQTEQQQQQQQHWQQGMLVDVGAGSGFFSLAAAAGGHPVLAFEASPDSLEAFNASIQYNGFQQLVSVFTTPLGAAPQQVCVDVDSDQDPDQQQQQQGYAATYGSRGSGSRVLASAQEAAGGADAVAASGDSGAAAAGAGAAGGVDPMAAAWNLTSWRAAREARLRIRRGYAHRSDGVPLPGSPACRRAVQRATLSQVLGNNAWVAALRIAAHGHEGWVLEGALPYLTKVHRPAAVYLEFCPTAMRAAGYANPQRVLELLHGLGYTDAAHAGHACDMRWRNVTRSLRVSVVEGWPRGCCAEGRAGRSQGCTGRVWWPDTPVAHVCMVPFEHGRWLGHGETGRNPIMFMLAGLREHMQVQHAGGSRISLKAAPASKALSDTNTHPLCSACRCFVPVAGQLRTPERRTAPADLVQAAAGALARAAAACAPQYAREPAAGAPAAGACR